MPKYRGKQIFSPGSIYEMGQKQKTEKKEKETDSYASYTGGARKVARAKINF